MTTFAPAYGNNKSISLTASSQTVAIPKECRAVRINNNDPAAKLWFCVTSAANSRAATTADCPVGANKELIVAIPNDAERVSVIGSAIGTVAVDVTPGALLEP